MERRTIKWTRRLLGGLSSTVLFLLAIACGSVAVALAPWLSVATIFDQQYLLSIPFALIAWGAWNLAVDCWPD